MALFIPFKKFLKESEITEETSVDSKTIFSDIVKFLKDGGYITKDDTSGEWLLTGETSEDRAVEDLVDITTLLELLNRNIPPDVFEEACATCTIDDGEPISESVETENEAEAFTEPIDDALEAEIDKELADVTEDTDLAIDEAQEEVEETEEALEEKEEKLEEDEEIMEDLGLDTSDIDEKQEEVEEEEEVVEEKEEVLEEEEEEVEAQLNEAKYNRLKKFVKEANEQRGLDKDVLKQRISDKRKELMEARKRRLGKERLFESLKKKRYND
jgi:hypothetical protein